MRFAGKWVLPFLSLLGLGLAVSIPWLLAVWTDDDSNDSRIAIVVISAVFMAVAASATTLLLYHLATSGIPKLSRRLAVWVTFRTIHKLVAELEPAINPIGITPFDDGVGVGLPTGIQDGVIVAEQFVVLNASSGDKWGMLEVSSVWEDSCVCFVSDRINEEFWDNLERKMWQDPSFPAGASVRRKIPEEHLFDWLRALLKSRGA